MIAAPEALTAAASDLRGIEDRLRAATTAAAVRTTAILPLAGDEVSAAVTTLFGAFGQDYQTLSAQVSLFHEQFTRAVGAGAGAYTAAEAVNVSPLQPLEQNVLGLINAPT
ncbi:PE family protein, partial [Mycobacterium gordonae]|uniref:PE family protein n=1 Tax=Mycobacterium gordonae TaxID=1778 RepID=UPI0020A267E4